MVGRLRILATLLLVLPLAGCFAGRSFPMRPERLVAVKTAQVTAAPTAGGPGERLATREWVAAVHPLVAIRLPWGESNGHAALLSGELREQHGAVLNVYEHFGLDEKELDSLWCNLEGLEQTSQVASPTPYTNSPAPTSSATTPEHMWTGFREVAIPVNLGAARLRLYGRLGTPEPANEIPGSYIVITHGLFGSLDGTDMENHVQALRLAGHHVLAIEMRGHGVTRQRYPGSAVTFGLCETADLLAVAHWLKSEQHATRVGLVSFSLTGLESLLAAWLDGDSPPLDAVDTQRPVCRYACAPRAEAAYNGGMFLVSVPMDIAATNEQFEKRWGLFEAPCKATFQQHMADRLRSFGEPPTYRMWAFIEAELGRDGWGKAYGSLEALQADVKWYTDLHAEGWGMGVRRLERVRNPVLVLSAANDPLGTAQGVAELLARVNNPNVGLIMLKGGGHMGFPALSADYYYSLMRAFFDPATAPRALTGGADEPLAQDTKTLGNSPRARTP